MTYNPTAWQDQIVTDPIKYKIIKQDGTEEIVNIEKDPGEIIQEGTKITAARLNNIEQGISDSVNGIDEIGTQMAELASEVGDTTTLTTTDKTSVVNAINEVNSKPTTDPDKGRFNSSWGFDGAELVDCYNINENVGLDGENVIATIQNPGNPSSTGVIIYDNYGFGQYISSALTTDIDLIKSIKVGFADKAGSFTSLKASIYDRTLGQELGFKEISYANITYNASTPTFYEIIFDTPIVFTRGNELEIRLNLIGASGGVSNRVDVNYSSNAATSDNYGIYTSDGWVTVNTSTSYNSTYQSMWFELQTETINATTQGTATKTITPNKNAISWGNLKYECQDLDGTNGVEVEVLNNIDTIIPIMTSNTTPNGIASASSEVTNQEAYKAFNGDTTPWLANATTGWLKYEFPNATVVEVYRILATLSDYSLTDWTFEGSNDDINWDILDTQSAITDWNGEYKTYNLNNSASYKYYRINITANYGNPSYVGLRELQMSKNTIKSQTAQNGENILDLSDIDPTQYPSIKTKFTLNRNTTSDKTPILSNPSWTWEGASIDETAFPFNYTEIGEINLEVNSAQVIFDNIAEDFLRLYLVAENLLCTVQQGKLLISINDGSSFQLGANYQLQTTEPRSHTEGQIYYSFSPSATKNKVAITSQYGELRDGCRFILLGVKK